MAQHDYVLANQTFPDFRTDANNALAAAVTMNSGATEPAATFAAMLWYDTTLDIVKMRNDADDAWVSLFLLDQTNDAVSFKMTTRGDILRGDANGHEARYALGAVNFLLASDGTDAAWAWEVLDEDTLVSNSATKLASQQSIKAYVDTQVAAHGLVQSVSTQTGAVATGATVLPFDDTIPQNTEGDEYMTRAITPTNASNILEITVTVVLATTAAAGDKLAVALFQDTTAGALAAMAQHVIGSNNLHNITFVHRMVAGTAGATTFKVRAGCDGSGTTTLNGQSGGRIFGGVMASSIVIKELEV